MATCRASWRLGGRPFCFQKRKASSRSVLGAKGGGKAAQGLRCVGVAACFVQTKRGRTGVGRRSKVWLEVQKCGRKVKKGVPERDHLGGLLGGATCRPHMQVEEVV
eukprot:359189-Chlamydomonas_euryale.AAC.12